MNKNCKTCRYWLNHSCYRFPPVRSLTSEPDFDWAEKNETGKESEVAYTRILGEWKRPSVGEEDFCGEWKEKEEKGIKPSPQLFPYFNKMLEKYS